MVGGGGWVVYSKFSVLLWSKAVVLDLDQVEQYFGYCKLHIADYTKQTTHSEIALIRLHTPNWTNKFALNKLPQSNLHKVKCSKQIAHSELLKVNSIRQFAQSKLQKEKLHKPICTNKISIS